ncbi:MAG: hypothetical protein H7Y09_07660 [Chitinophagaceae bacterium]|nr:hypothetical protein [Anaerolineae bacterium]
MKRLINLSIGLLMLLFISINISGHVMAQDTCLPPRFLPGMPVQVVGSVDAGGLPFRGSIGLAGNVLGFIPLGTSITVEESAICEEGRNWYPVSADYTTVASDYSVWVTDGDGTSYWLEPVGFCEIPEWLGNGVQINLWNTIDDIVTMDYAADDHLLYLTTSGDDVPQHPVLLDHYTIDVETGILTEGDYQYVDIVTPELTDALGISAYVFGERSFSYALLISPDQQKILYFIPDPPIESCAHGCLRDQVYIADVDGTDSIFLGRIYSGYLETVHWGANERLYLTMHSEAAFNYYTIELCMDGSCGALFDDVLEERGLPFYDEVVGFPAVSPDGRHMAFERFNFTGSEEGSGTVILDLEDNSWIELPDNGNVALPIIWEDDTTMMYPIDVDSVIRPAEAEGYNYDHDFVRMLTLDFAEGTFRLRDQVTLWDEDMFGEWMKGEWLRLDRAFIIPRLDLLNIACISFG